jgi:hypothetical protein
MYFLLLSALLRIEPFFGYYLRNFIPVGKMFQFYIKGKYIYTIIIKYIIMTSNATYTIIAIVAMSALLGLALVLPFTPAPAKACGRCWNGQADEHRSDGSYAADEHHFEDLKHKK